MANKSAIPSRRERRTGHSLARLALISAFVLIRPVAATAHGDLHDQIAAVTRKITADPGNARLYLKRAELRRFHGELAAALADYDRASQLDASLVEADLGRGRALLEVNRSQAAKRALERFVRARPNDPEGRLALARCLAKLGHPAGAASEYSRALRLLPSPKPDIYVELALALTDVRDLAGAIRALDEGIERLGPLVALEDLAIHLELERKNWNAALDRLDRITPALGRRETLLARRGEILASAGRAREARQVFAAARRAIESLPPRLRGTRAIKQLEEKIRKALEELATRSAQKETTDAKS